MHLLKTITILLFITSSLASRAEHVNIFEQDIIKISIRTDFNTLLKDKRFYSRKENFIKGEVKYQNYNFQVKINTAGNTRLGCDLPPLKLRFDKSEVRDTPFEGNKKMKLITHCDEFRSKKDLNEKVYREYRLYKRFEKKSKFHFKTQLVIIHYVNKNGENHFQSSPYLAFLIEGDRSVENRTQTEEIKFDATGWSQNIYPSLELDKRQLRKTKWFNWIIGNQDYGISAQEDDGRLYRKNIKVFASNNVGYVIPYDFDRAPSVFKNKFKIYRHKLRRWAKNLYKNE